MSRETLKELLDKLSEILNEYEEDNNAVIICDINISTKTDTDSFSFDGAHFTEISDEELER